MLRLRRLLSLTVSASLLTLPACAPTTAEMPPPLALDGAGLPPPAEESGKDGDEKPKWDIDNPPGPTKEVVIDTDEGTWMSLDLSPDGQQIVFDLLGDIYTIPVGGGEARPLTSGMSWDMQPRFSPDGKYIAFTSDRGGGDNVWVMNADGSDPKAVTDEDFRLVNSPVWSPDGEYIAVRKHFTAERSLGAGEVWLYHRTGGGGLQLTKKPNDQKDLGEPAFSPDGRYVYYSQDTTPGKYFEYNKDPHGQIYVIKRIDLKEQRTEVFISGAGGAVRPTPSPDGKSLAFVRRVGLKTALFIHDIESGKNTMVFDGLERDMQETWAIHGVYPTMAWAPDNQSIVLWAGGKIGRVDLASKSFKEIPFHISGKRKVLEALRSPIEVHPAKFDTKMLRWVQTAPDGKSVVYQALGRLYVHDLETKKVRRITTDDDVFEFYPSFSRDGSTIVYTTWNDTGLGTVRTVPARGGKGKTITAKPGHYVEPRFSPDGKTIVYRKVSGGRLRSPTWSRDTGLYAVPAKGGDPDRISREGFDPHFGADSDRVYYMKGVDEGKSELRSIGLDGREQRTHLRSDFADEFRVSPDGRWVAYQELFHVYVTPFPATGKTVEVGPKSKAIPQTKLTRDAGAYLHWSGDARKLHWALGPELYTREIQTSFSFLEGAPEKLPEPATQGVNIGFSMDSDVPTGKVAFVGARIVTMQGDTVIEDGAVVVEGNRITAVGFRANVQIPADATTFDVKGKTIIPGIVDVHAHGPQGRQGIIPQQNWLHYAQLTFGVTTTHDPSNDTATIFASSELARAGLITAPRIFSTGTILYGAKAAFKAVISDLDDARTHLRRMKAVGAFSVKSYNQPRRNQRQQVVVAARELDMMVVPEGGSLYQHNMTMVVDGHTGVEHAIPVAKAYKDAIQLWAGTGVGYTPTTGVGYGGIWGENYWYAHTDVFAHPKMQTFVPPFVVNPRSRRRMYASDGDWNHVEVAKTAKALSDAGVKVNVGAHGQREGLASHWEMWMFVQGGMTPMEALRAATLNGAHYLGLDKDIGSIEVGKLADMAIIDGNPLEDIRTSDRVVYTVLNGRVFDATSMDEVGNHPRKREPFFWQQ